MSEIPVTPERSKLVEALAKGSRASADSRKAAVLTRQAQIKKLIIRGVKDVPSLHASITQMGYTVDIRTVQRDVAAIKVQHEKDVREKVGLDRSIEELVINLQATFEEITREAWKIYHQSNKIEQSVVCYGCKVTNKAMFTIPSAPAAKVAALKLIKETSEDIIERLQSLGLVFKAPDKTQHQFVGSDGKPVDKSTLDLEVLNAEFTTFITQHHQDPLVLNPKASTNGGHPSAD